MAMLLSLLMVSNMIGAISLLPLLVKVFKPSFVMKSQVDESSTGEESTEPANTAA
jgi:hypothetical protein